MLILILELTTGKVFGGDDNFGTVIETALFDGGRIDFRWPSFNFCTSNGTERLAALFRSASSDRAISEKCLRVSTRYLRFALSFYLNAQLIVTGPLNRIINRFN